MGLESTDDMELVKRCLRDDRNAFAQLVNRHKKMVFNAAYRILGNVEDAEDIAQEVFLRVYTALPRFRGDSKFSVWLYSIVSNICMTQRKKHSRDTIVVNALRDEDMVYSQPADSMEDNPARIVECREVSARIRKLVAALPAQYSTVITLRYLQGCTYTEIAEILKIPMGTVKTQLFRAKEMLKELAVKQHISFEE